MKTKILLSTLLAGSFVCGAIAAQTSSGGVSVAPNAPAPRTGITPTVRPNGTIQQNGTVQTAPGVAAPGATMNGQSTMTTTTNGFAGTNSLADTNNFNGTNNFAGTNGFGGTNNVAGNVNYNTNFNVNINSNFNGNVVMQDQAVTPSDRVLLTTLSQGVRATLGITTDGNTPVHFLIQNGTVTVTGTVQSTAQTQAVLAQVQQTPGVIAVINDMHVRGPYAPIAANGSGSLLLGVPTDRAFSANDQRLLTTVQQEAAMQLGVTATSQMPVHFSIENGVVGVTGQVNSQQEKQALLAAIARTAGIVRVVDNVGVIPSASGNVSGNFVGPSSTTVNGVLTPTSRETNNLVSTNSSGF